MNALDISLQRRFVSSPAHGLARRLIDLAVAGAATLVFAPLMLLIAGALLLEGGGSILFTQTRMGVGGRPFRMYKFRKFDVNCGSQGLALTVVGDSRMTMVGRFLAATKFDELPQLWNVLKGEMAIVGPRPESMAFADCFRGGLEAVLQYKPGLLGPTQVLFRHEAHFFPRSADPILFYREVMFPAKARLDLSYYPQRTIVSDIVWMARGVLAVVGWVPSQPIDV
ncbi:sugar transferase [Mesorhizobium japonicum]|uniref:Sugar transferase n=2 Tax=Mesorhizobium TaxID=68287 RepID=A0A1A5K0B6_RHILI|nr:MULTISPECIES: sugar transferase [Mesorhizobium]ETA71395.1 glycosyl transferase possibly involved in lipopolysaccharide synthesis [Mesorhizobium japonicum R7A]MBE1711793.1 sugar transferase [Mesorhizobium japonicum]MBE1717655.1 sugar transferase [Mesorhizobium japonicum]OBP75023.1 sugar transferase [Mesorhizobium loti]OBP77800.1 sugar transferase [Mesorhizobium loti]